MITWHGWTITWPHCMITQPHSMITWSHCMITWPHCVHTGQPYIFTSSKLRDGGGLSDGQVNALNHHPVSCRHSTDLDRVTSLRHPQSTNLVVHTNVDWVRKISVYTKPNSRVTISKTAIILVYSITTAPSMGQLDDILPVQPSSPPRLPACSSLLGYELAAQHTLCVCMCVGVWRLLNISHTTLTHYPHITLKHHPHTPPSHVPLITLPNAWKTVASWVG